MEQDSKLIKKQAEALIPTPWGNFTMMAFAHNEEDWMPHLALVHEDFSPGAPTLVRLHSECITGDLFGSKRCDCGEQLHSSLKMTAEAGGVVLYLRQEGRENGISNKLKAYQIQDLGLNTIDANVHLGLEIDARQYDMAIEMLRALDIKEIRLITNNPDKVDAIEHSDIRVMERVPIVMIPKKENLDYLKTKQEKMGHFFNL